MADIDTDADIEVHQAEGELVVTIPLVGEVSKHRVHLVSEAPP